MSAAAACAVAVDACSSSSSDAGTSDASTSDTGTSDTSVSDDGGLDAACRHGDGVYVPCGSWSVPLEGDPSACGADDAGRFTTAACADLCGHSAFCQLAPDGGASVVCTESCGPDCSLPPDVTDVCGRLPEALPSHKAPRALDVGTHFARVAFHEAASVDAFVALRHELRAHRAPPSLLRAAAGAAGDERRHAAMATKLARRHGARPTRARIALRAPRSLEQIAIENAREGCGRELLGVLVGSMQARRARDRAVRDFYARVTADEARHAAFSFRLHAWLWRRLGPSARRAVRAELERTYETMALLPLPHAIRETLGLPDARALRAATRALFAEVVRVFE